MQDQKLRRKQGDKGKYQMSIVNNSVVMEDINQNESESDENKSGTIAEYKDDAVESRLERAKKQNWIPQTYLAREETVLLDFGVIQPGHLVLAIDPVKWFSS